MSVGKKRHSHVWGTYFIRLIAFGNGRENQLGKAIEGLANWKSKPRAAFVLHLSSTDLDNLVPSALLAGNTHSLSATETTNFRCLPFIVLTIIFRRRSEISSG